MAIAIADISLYRPTASFKREFFKDNYSEIVGVKDDVTIQDQITYEDNPDLIGVLDSLIATTTNVALVNISYPGSGGSIKGRITGISIDTDSDLVNVLKYSITAEAYPQQVALNNKWGITAADGVRELTCTETGEDPKDIELILMPNGNTYCNKTKTFTFNIQVSCANVRGTSQRKLAQSVVAKLKKDAPFLLRRSIPNRFEGGALYYTGVEESFSEEGSASLQLTVSIFPDNCVGGVLLDSLEETVNSFSGEKTYKTKQYRATFRAVPNMGIGYPGVSNASNTVGLAIAAAENLASVFTNGTPDVITPGKTQVCTTDIPKLPEPDCYNTVSVGVEKNYGESTASCVIDQTTEPINCDGDGYLTEYSINTTKNKKTYAELFGWGVEKSIVQDLGCEATETKELTINISSKAKCLVSELKNKAQAKYDELSAGILSGGTLVKHSMIVNSGRCTVNASFIMTDGSESSS